MFHPLKMGIVFLLAVISVSSHADEYFEPTLLETFDENTPPPDLTHFSTKQLAPGKYRVKISINSDFYDRRMVDFIMDDHERLTPCFSEDEYTEMGIDKHSSLVTMNKTPAPCRPVYSVIEGATVHTDLSQLQLDLSIPQLALRSQVADDVPETLWDEGITAFISNYRLDGSSTRNNGESALSSRENDNFLNWNNGLNVGPWRLRDSSSWSNSNGWNNLSMYVKRSIRPLKSKLTMGDFSTQQDIFDPLALLGVQLSSDSAMLPNSINGFSPIVRGIAKSYAQVTVRNAGDIIYQTNVPPGPFALKDIVPVSDGGELDVTIKESNGAENHYIIPYASIPELQREGQLKYSLLAGQYKDETVGNKPNVIQASTAWGLPYNLTLLNGLQWSQHYQAASLGIGVDAGHLGALSLTAVHQKTQPEYENQKKSGTAARLSYAKVISTSDTTVHVENWLYSNNYLSFQDAYNPNQYESKIRNRQSVNINQPVSDEGESIYFTLSRTGYEESSDIIYQTGVNGSINGISYSVAVSKSKMSNNNEWDKQLALTVSVPFSVFSSDASYGSISYLMTQSGGKDNSQLVTASDALNDKQTLIYTASTSYENDNSGAKGAVSLDYKNSSGQEKIGYNYDEMQKQLTYGMSGGVLLHQGGVTFSQYMDNASALISIPNVSDISIEGYDGIKTDSNGYAVLPNIIPYRKNDVKVEPPAARDSEVEITALVNTVVPTKDAIVLAEFAARVGRKAIVILNYHSLPLPFGTEVKLVPGDQEFYVADNGLAYITGMPEEGTLSADFGNGQHCQTDYKLPQKKKAGKSSMVKMVLECN
ncbi:fimbria/pilus outer membrane usher protein [Rahnella sp. PD4]|uniref:fimbria/pilus outer membrane usher protein n=1 Tax=Rahnella sp. PD4 TaxID=3368611 RepID=UPI003BA0E1F5